MITNHTQLLNALIEKYNLKSYLEIGVNNPANNFDKVKCDVKVGVDPAVEANNVFKITSDKYFSTVIDLKLFNLIFIDGLHHSDQVKRDFENSLRCLSGNGFIVIHDVLPENEQGTKVPRETKQWWGDVYKWAMSLPNYDGIRYITYNIDNGCCLVQKLSNHRGKGTTVIPNWQSYLDMGKELMNVTDEVNI
jgi:predicted O-methyltransferase YrrM